MDPSELGRRELQNLAKQHGVRANAKSSVIFDELKKKGVFNITKRKRRKKPQRSQISQNANPNAASSSVTVSKKRRPETVSRSASKAKAACVAPIAPDYEGIRDLLGRILPSFRDIEKHYTLVKQLGDVRTCSYLCCGCTCLFDFLRYYYSQALRFFLFDTKIKSNKPRVK